MIRGVVFDIDDTLYWERAFVESGFRCAATLLGKSDAETRAIARWLDEAFAAGVRGDNFDRLLTEHPELADRMSAPELVEAYRSHRPSIALEPDALAAVAELRARGMRLGVLSDGPLESQSVKAAALELSRWFEPIVLTAALGPDAAKPSVVGFETFASVWRLRHRELAYVADNPEKDFVGPRRLGWMTIRLRRPEQLRFKLDAPTPDHEPAVEVGSLAALPGVLGLVEP